MTTVQTALGPIATTELGPTLMHEHVVTRSPGVQENWPHLWDRNAILDIAERKMADLYRRGIRSIDGGQVDDGADAAAIEVGHLTPFWTSPSARWPTSIAAASAPSST